MFSADYLKQNQPCLPEINTYNSGGRETGDGLKHKNPRAGSKKQEYSR